MKYRVTLKDVSPYTKMAMVDLQVQYYPRGRFRKIHRIEGRTVGLALQRLAEAQLDWEDKMNKVEQRLLDEK